MVQDGLTLTPCVDRQFGLRASAGGCLCSIRCLTLQEVHLSSFPDWTQGCRRRKTGQANWLILATHQPLLVSAFVTSELLQVLSWSLIRPCLIMFHWPGPQTCSLSTPHPYPPPQTCQQHKWPLCTTSGTVQFCETFTTSEHTSFFSSSSKAARVVWGTW